MHVNFETNIQKYLPCVEYTECPNNNTRTGSYIDIFLVSRKLPVILEFQDFAVSQVATPTRVAYFFFPLVLACALLFLV
jgi:hypothetical protein